MNTEGFDGLVKEEILKNKVDWFGHKHFRRPALLRKRYPVTISGSREYCFFLISCGGSILFMMRLIAKG
jgi:hypothetical protein